MNPQWMVYIFSISCLLSAAGLVVERACRLRRWPSRWIWALVLAAPFLLPFSASVREEPESRAVSPGRVESPIGSPDSPTSVADVATWGSAVDPKHRKYRPIMSPAVASLLTILWCGSSTLLALGLLNSWLRMRDKSASWATRNLDGTEVLVSDGVGPAVVGFLHPRIVVPAWLLQSDLQVRRLTLAHESEHVRARDPLLLLLATLSVVLMPWNLPLWWQWRRLRFAIEVDCDARVLASGRVAELTYAEALLNVAERSSEVPLAAAAMCESPSMLEKRVGLLLRDRRAHQHALVFVLLVAGVAVTAAAAQINAPAALGQREQQSLVKGALGKQLVQAINDGVRESAVDLIDAGADVNKVVLGDGSPLIVAVRHGDSSLANLLLERGAQVDLQVRGDGSPLIAASMLGNLDIVRTLVERGADVNGFVPGDETPLINAARAGHLDVVRYLVANGADVNLAVPAESERAAEIRSPLGEALKYGHTPVVEYLRTQGAAPR